MAKLFVRVNPKSGKKQFFRAGIHFTNEWQEVEVDDVTAATLQAEQVLDVTDSVAEQAPVEPVANSVADPVKKGK